MKTEGIERSTVRQIVGLWLAWLLILLIYQAAVTARYSVQKPDRVLPWTVANTNEHPAEHPYLNEPFLNAQVAWDSEFYLSIALNGYDDPQIRTVPPIADAQPPFNRPLSLNYAFFPVYPVLIRLISAPLSLLGLTPIAAAISAGVLISALGTLAGMISLYQLASQSGGTPAGLRSVFYLISFPTSFFLAQVYTEGLFIGLSFGCLALLQRKHWVAAAGLAAIATLTRAIGVALLIPILLSWLQNTKSQPLSPRQLLARLPQLVVLFSPLIVHLIWRFSFLGHAFQIVEENFFKCRLFDLSAALTAWQTAFLALFGSNLATATHSTIEFAAVLLGILSCLLTLKQYPGISLYGLVIIIVSCTCGTAWSISRYLLSVPSVFLVLSQLGQAELFDRIWSFISILFLAMLTALFSFNLWAG